MLAVDIYGNYEYYKNMSIPDNVEIFHLLFLRHSLIHRTETQARDIFDIKLLLDQGAHVNLKKLSHSDIQVAIKNIQTISYADYKGHVIAFLMDEYKSLYDSEKKWCEICTAGIDFLKGEEDAAH